jgi:hypothetical protein
LLQSPKGQAETHVSVFKNFFKIVTSIYLDLVVSGEVTEEIAIVRRRIFAAGHRAADVRVVD